MPEITSNVKFENVAREWRCKWSGDGEKASLAALQAKLDDVLGELSSVEGVSSVQRIVCGGCLDFKIVTKLSAAAFGEWEKMGFAPEAAFLDAIKSIAGVSSVETQTYTIEEVKMNAKEIKKYKAKVADEKEKAAAEAPPPPIDPAKKLKAVIKEGGKRGVEIEGAADMGGLQFFCTSVDEPDGDTDLLAECVKAMNAKSDPTEEERKGGSGHIGKMCFSAGTEQLAVVAYVPDEKQKELSCEEWLNAVLKEQGGKIITKAKDICIGVVKANADKGVFPLKIREPMILSANNFLRSKGLFPEDNDDSDEMVFGDDDFPSYDATADSQPAEKVETSLAQVNQTEPQRELTAEEKAKLKKVVKEGGKRGVEIEGAADMGGLQFFCTSVDEPEGSVQLVVECMKAMNAKSDPTEEERKGGSGHIG